MKPERIALKKGERSLNASVLRIHAIHPDHFSILSVEDMERQILQETDQELILESISGLRMALLEYSPEFFGNMRDSESPRGLRFLLTEGFSDGSPDPGACGAMVCEYSWYNIVLDMHHMEESDIHHEIWHAIEKRIRRRMQGVFEIWNVMNPPGFAYACEDPAACSLYYDEHYFASAEGAVSAEEDRATLAGMIGDWLPYTWIEERPMVIRKARAMNLVVAWDFGFEYDEVKDVCDDMDL